MDDLLPFVGGVLLPEDAETDAPAAPGTSWDDLDADEGWLPWIPTVELQLDANACTAFATEAVFDALTRTMTGARAHLSHMDLYWGSRWLRSAHRQNVGLYAADVARWISGWGLCPRAAWGPYDPSKVTNTDPPPQAVSDRRFNKVPMRRLGGSADVARAILGRDGLPRRGATFAHKVHDDFLTRTRTEGIVWGPVGTYRGAHLEAFVGFTRRDVPGMAKGPKLIGMNSWRWGIPNPVTPGIHPYGFAYWPATLVDDRSFVWDIYAPDAPMPVEA